MSGASRWLDAELIPGARPSVVPAAVRTAMPAMNARLRRFVVRWSSIGTSLVLGGSGLAADLDAVPSPRAGALVVAVLSRGPCRIPLFDPTSPPPRADLADLRCVRRIGWDWSRITRTNS